WWLLLTLLPLCTAVFSYRSMVSQAIGYGVALTSAIDLHRFSLYEALHLPAPLTLAAELELARQLAQQWRQNAIPAWTFAHGQGAP
ncbi:hypothetical protein, partial [Frankia sp. Cr1]|uniref:hypothetical protein n=1 Tax=Frankia sp. Cr1 TaxID=3073931 RepID=UPI002AD43682